MSSILIVALVIVAGSWFAIHRFRRRVERGAEAKARAKAAQARTLLEGRLTAEAEYVLSRLQNEAAWPQHLTANPGGVGRVAELREVLVRTFSPSPRAFPLSGPCAEVINGFRELVQDRDLVYSESGDGRWLHVHGDRELLGWAVHELFANAVQHAGDWTRIAVLAEPGDGAVVLTLRDDGRGLDPSAAARLYSPFTPRTGSDGAGVGLYLVRRIVETAGGTIEARSAPGQGLLHRLRLPYPPAGPYSQSQKRSE